MKKKICIVLCLGCIGTVSVVGCSNKNFDSKVTGDNQTTTENVSDILNDQEKKEGGWLLYQNYADQGYTQSKTHQIDEHRSVMHTYWTQKGRIFLYDILKNEGILPLIEIED